MTGTSQQTTDKTDHKTDHKTWTKNIEVAGEELLARVRELAADSKVKRIRVTEPDGDIALEIPLAYGAIAGGAVVIAAPVLAVIGALAALVSKVHIDIIEDTSDAEAAAQDEPDA